MKYSFKPAFSAIFFLFFFAAHSGFAQKTTVITGKVKDGDTDEPIPFASVFFPGTSIGATTDFEGYYTIRTTNATDTLKASFAGYEPKTTLVKIGEEQTINFTLKTEILGAVVITDKKYKEENPAWPILRQVIANKKANDQRKLNAYECESYSKIELAVDNITDKFKKRKIVRKILNVLDSIERMSGDDGKPVLPVFMSETLSDFYYRKDPVKRHERIRKTRIKGVAIDDGSLVSQVIGSTFQDYNFYMNWLSVAGKDFVSPIADSWRLFYNYELENRAVKIDDITCFQISFSPKRPEDLAFSGTMWITDSTFALKRIDVTIGKSANLNFIEKVKVQQELTAVSDNEVMVWMPSKTRVILDVGQVRDDWAGMLAKSYVSRKNFRINTPKEPSFYKDPLVVADDAQETTEAFWTENRHDSLTVEEQKVRLMIDTIRNLPVVKTYVEVANILIEGHKKVGKFDIGAYPVLYANNNIEGHRFRLQIRSNADFSKRMRFRAYGAYGTRDERFKYMGLMDFIIARRPWTLFGFSRKEDIHQIALFNEDFRNSSNYLFRASTYWGNLDNNRAFWHVENNVYLQTDVVKGVTLKTSFRQQDIDPLFLFEYFDPLNQGARRSTFSTSELIAEVRVSFRENFLMGDLMRISLGSGDRPVLTFRYVKGFESAGGDFDYQKFYGSVNHSFRMGSLGRSEYSLNAGIIPDELPYPILENHLGNESPFYNQLSFNLMEYFEFTSDKFVSLRYTHRFEGLLLNRIPIMRKLKWRAMAEGTALWGSVRDENIALIPGFSEDGEEIPGFGRLGNEPYVEVSYGIENILKFIRVQAIHRLTYLEKENVNRFGVKVSALFRL